ncbi:amidase family protein [Glutamicibacter sp. BSL13]
MTDHHGQDGIWTHLEDLPDTDAGPPHDNAAIAGEGEFNFAVKANIQVQGLPTNAASPVYGGYRAPADALVVSILRQHGGRVHGLTNMHELAFGITSNNAVYGPVRNPYDRQRTAGGSSGGSAAAVAAGTVRMSLGTDTGGSISIPASSCGVVGFRPSTGRWPIDGIIGLSTSRDTIGVHTPTVAEASLLDNWISNTPPTPAPVARARLGLPAAFHRDLDPDVARVLRRALKSLEPHVHFVDVDLSPIIALTDRAQWDLVGWEAPRLLSAYLAAAEDLSPTRAWAEVVHRAASPDVRGILDSYASEPVDQRSYQQARLAMAAARERYARLMEHQRLDALFFPTMPALPQRVGEDHVVDHCGQPTALFPLMTRNVGPGTILGVPSVTLSAGRGSHGLPVGMTVQGSAHQDADLLALAGQLEPLLARAC